MDKKIAATRAVDRTDFPIGPIINGHLVRENVGLNTQEKAGIDGVIGLNLGIYLEITVRL